MTGAPFPWDIFIVKYPVNLQAPVFCDGLVWQAGVEEVAEELEKRASIVDVRALVDARAAASAADLDATLAKKASKDVRRKSAATVLQKQE